MVVIMTGNVSKEELGAALSLSEGVKGQIDAYEHRNWAVNLNAPDLKIPWSEFLSAFERGIKAGQFKNNEIVSLINYLSTMDTVGLLAKVGELDPTRQARFLQLLNWVASESKDMSQRSSAKGVQERILMAYRLENYPKIYSTARIARATQVMSSSKK